MPGPENQKLGVTVLIPFFVALMLALSGVLAMGALFILSGIVVVPAVIVVSILLTFGLLLVVLLFVILSRSMSAAGVKPGMTDKRGQK